MIWIIKKTDAEYEYLYFAGREDLGSPTIPVHGIRFQSWGARKHAEQYDSRRNAKRDLRVINNERPGNSLIYSIEWLGLQSMPCVRRLQLFCERAWLTFKVVTRIKQYQHRMRGGSDFIQDFVRKMPRD